MEGDMNGMERQDKPLAVVNSSAIYNSDVDEFIMSMGQRGASLNNAEGRAMVLEQLIARKLFLADALRNVYEREPAFKEQLRDVREQLLIQYAMNKAVEGVKVTDAEVKQYFDEHADQFAAQPVVSASHILVDNELKAHSILKEIRAGGISFEDAARKYSSCPSAQQGGNLGEFGRGQMVPEFDQAVFSMEVGEIAGPVKTQFGYHLIRLDEKKDSEPITFEQVKQELSAHLLEEKRQKAFQSKVNQLKILFPVDRG